MSQQLKILKIIFYAIVIGTVAMLGVYTYLVINGTFSEIDNTKALHNIFKYLIPALGVLSNTSNYITHRRKLEVLNSNAITKKSFADYKELFIIRLAMLESIALFSGVALMITSNYLYLAYGLITLCFMYPVYPTLEKISTDLGVTTEELRQIMDEMK